MKRKKRRMIVLCQCVRVQRAFPLKDWMKKHKRKEKKKWMSVKVWNGINKVKGTISSLHFGYLLFVRVHIRNGKCNEHKGIKATKKKKTNNKWNEYRIFSTKFYVLLGLDARILWIVRRCQWNYIKWCMDEHGLSYQRQYVDILWTLWSVCHISTKRRNFSLMSMCRPYTFYTHCAHTHTVSVFFHAIFHIL